MDTRQNRVESQQYPPEDAPVTPTDTSIGPSGGTVSPAWPGNANTALEAERYEQARKRVRQLRAFYASLTTYVFVNLLLFLINLITAPGTWWFIWPLFGWGIGIAAQAWSVYAPRFDKDWEARKIEKELRKNP